MSDGVFVDTNTLIYAHDADAGIKRERAAHQLAASSRARQDGA